MKSSPRSTRRWSTGTPNSTGSTAISPTFRPRPKTSRQYLLGPDRDHPTIPPQARAAVRSRTPADLGRAITKVRHDLQLLELETFIAEVIDGGQEREREVQDRDRSLGYRSRVLALI